MFLTQVIYVSEYAINTGIQYTCTTYKKSNFSLLKISHYIAIIYRLNKHTKLFMLPVVGMLLTQVYSIYKKVIFPY